MKRVHRRSYRDPLPTGAKLVARPSRWGNPYPASLGQDAIDGFRVYAEDRLRRQPDWLEPLQGYDLACYCPPNQPCHADVLLELLMRKR